MMQPSALRRIAAVFFAATVTSICAFAQPAKHYQPKEYQDGKDVVWVPTAQTLVDRMLDIANVTASDYVIDLGSGDGRTVITAAKRGAKALGIEYNPKMVELSKANAAKEGVTDKATFVKADLFKTDFSQATVITMFLLPEINLKLRPKILDMKPGTRVVSNSFDMGDWKADQTIDTVGSARPTATPSSGSCRPRSRALELPQGKLALKQNFQFVTGTLTHGNVVAPVKGRLNGADITFTAGGTQYTGHVDGNAMEGTTKTGDKQEPGRRRAAVARRSHRQPAHQRGVATWLRACMLHLAGNDQACTEPCRCVQGAMVP